MKTETKKNWLTLIEPVEDYECGRETEPRPVMLNVSNHPFECWSKTQKEAACGMIGKAETVIDVPHPHIPPEVSATGVKDIVRDLFLEEILPALQQEGRSEHQRRRIILQVGGEQTFIWQVVCLAERWGIASYCSTTERKVEEKDGKKISTFNFVRFRRMGIPAGGWHPLVTPDNAQG